MSTFYVTGLPIGGGVARRVGGPYHCMEQAKEQFPALRSQFTSKNGTSIFEWLFIEEEKSDGSIDMHGYDKNSGQWRLVYSQPPTPKAI